MFRLATTQFLLCLLGAAGLLLPAGCGSSYESTVTGMVTLDGELLDGGTVAFHPIGDGPIAYGKIHGDGSYSLRTGQGDPEDPDVGGLAAGDYVVTVLYRAAPVEPYGERGGPADPGPLLTPARYAEVQTSDLRLTVKPGANLFAIQLERSAEDAESAAGQPGPEAFAEPSPADKPAAKEAAVPGEATAADTSDGEPEAETGAEEQSEPKEAGAGADQAADKPSTQ